MLPVLWGHGALRGASSVHSVGMSMVRSQFLIECHHVPFLPAVSSFSHLFHLPLQRAVHTPSLLLSHGIKGQRDV